MPGKHDLHKHQVSIKWPHSIWRKIEKGAEEHRMKPAEYIRYIVIREVANIELTAEDAQIVADRIKLAELKGKIV